MPVLLITSLAFATAAATGAPSEGQQVRCTLPAPTFTGKPSPGPHRFARLPLASLYLTVDRRIEGCPSPLIVRSSIGGK